MATETDLKTKIHASNAEAHDFWADTHDRNVPYINRYATRQYYWGLIKSGLKLASVSAKDTDVLEIGCGTGTFTDLFVKNGAKSFTGIDLSERMIEKAIQKAKLNQYKVPVSYHVVSLEDFAKANVGKFDIIQSSSFIHHLADVEEGMELIRSMLKPQGCYIAIHETINDHAKHWIEDLDDNLQYLFGYGGFGILPFKQRAKETTKKALRFIKKALSDKGRTREVNPVPSSQNVAIENKEIDYVDFQLNKPFSLTKNCAKYGIVQPYCYLGFSELMVFGKPLNHEMLIMKNNRT